MHIIRMIKDQSNKKQEQKISVQVPVDVATYLLNEKRDLIIQSESENNNKIFIIANKYFDVPQFKITTTDLNDKKSLSYQEIEVPETDIDEDIQQTSREVVEPAVKGLIPEKRAKKNKSLFGLIKGLIASDSDQDDDLPIEAEQTGNVIPKSDPQENFKKPFKNKQTLFYTAIAIFNNATKKRALKILRAHPDLAVKQKLTKESTREQKNAKLNECILKEFNEFQHLNKEYKQKFGFPFIIAVKGKTKKIILDSFKKKVNNSISKEFITAKKQVEKIANFRLKDLVK